MSIIYFLNNLLFKKIFINNLLLPARSICDLAVYRHYYCYDINVYNPPYI